MILKTKSSCDLEQPTEEATPETEFTGGEPLSSQEVRDVQCVVSSDSVPPVSTLVEEDPGMKGSAERPTKVRENGSKNPAISVALSKAVLPSTGEAAKGVEGTEPEAADNLQDFLSPAAQRITDEILRECQASSSSVESSLASRSFSCDREGSLLPEADCRESATAVNTRSKATHEDQQRTGSTEQHVPTLLQEVGSSANDLERPESTHSKEVITDLTVDLPPCPGSGKPSSIFVDLTTLNAPSDEDSASTHSH